MTIINCPFSRISCLLLDFSFILNREKRVRLKPKSVKNVKPLRNRSKGYVCLHRGYGNRERGYRLRWPNLGIVGGIVIGQVAV